MTEPISCATPTAELMYVLPLVMTVMRNEANTMPMGFALPSRLTAMESKPTSVSTRGWMEPRYPR